MNKIKHAFDRSRDGFREPLGIGYDMVGIFRKFAAAFCDHVSKGPPGIMLKMPFRRHDVGQKPVQLFRIVNQLCE